MRPKIARSPIEKNSRRRETFAVAGILLAAVFVGVGGAIPALSASTSLNTVHVFATASGSQTGSASGNVTGVVTPTVNVSPMVLATGNQTSTDSGNQTSTDSGNQTSTDSGNQTWVVTPIYALVTGNQTSTGSGNQTSTDSGNQTSTDSGNQTRGITPIYVAAPHSQASSSSLGWGSLAEVTVVSVTIIAAVSITVLLRRHPPP